MSARGAAIDALILLVIGLGVFGYQLSRRRGRARRQLTHERSLERRGDRLPTPGDRVAVIRPPVPSAGELLPLADWVFDYERMMITSESPPVERERALRVLSLMVVPLVGHVRVCELDDELVRSVDRVLKAQLRPNHAPVAERAWAHFVGWMRFHAAPPERRNMWALFDPEIGSVDDDFTDR